PRSGARAGDRGRWPSGRTRRRKRRWRSSSGRRYDPCAACGTWFAWVATSPLPRFTCRTGGTLAVATLAAGAAGFFLLLLTNLGEVEDLALVDPYLDADHAVGGVSLGKPVVDVRAPGMQRHAAFAVPLRTGGLGAVEPASDVDLDAQGTQAHRVADGALHRAAEHDAALKLLRDGLGDQLRVQLGLAHLAD